MAATSFNTQGATPQTPMLPGLGGGGTSYNTSQGRALQSALQSGSSLNLKTAPPPVNQPVKKQTVTDTAGNTHTTEYHPPITPTNTSNSTQTPSTSTPTPPPTPTATYPGIINSLADTSQKGSPTVQAAQAGLLKTTQTNPLESGGAYQTYSDAVAKEQKLKSDIAAKYGDIESDTIPLQFQQGREQALARQYAGQEEAAAQGVTQAQTALGYGIQEQGVQQTGLNDAGALGNTAQGQAITGLGAAGALAKPSVEAPGQAVFNPATGQYTSASSGGGNPSTAPSGIDQNSWDNYVQMAAKGQYASIPSSITGNANLSGQLNAAAKVINPSYSPITSSAQGQVLATIPAMQSANTAAEGIKNKIVSYLSANPALNASQLTSGNILQQWIQGKQLADPKYQTLFDYLSEYTNTLAPILGVGGDTTNLKTEIAQGFIDAAASGQSIPEVLNNIGSLASGKIQDLQSGATGGGVVSPSASKEITTQAADGQTYGFYQDANGTWHAK